MPRMQNVTDDQVQSAVEELENLMHTFHDYAERIEKGYSEPISGALEPVQTINRAIRTLAQMNSMILFKRRLDEQRAELETLLRQPGAS